MKYLFSLGLLSLLLYLLSSANFGENNNSWVVFTIFGVIVLFIQVLTQLFDKIKIVRIFPYVILPLTFSFINKSHGVFILDSHYEMIEMFLLAIITLFSSQNLVGKVKFQFFAEEIGQATIKFISYFIILIFLQFVLFDIPYFEIIRNFKSNELLFLSLLIIFPAPLISNQLLADRSKEYFQGLRNFSIYHLFLLIIIIFSLLIGAKSHTALFNLIIDLAFAVVIFTVVFFYFRYINKRFMHFLLGVFIAVYYLDLIVSDFDYFITFFIVGVFISLYNEMSEELKNYSKRYNQIALVLFAVIYLSKIEINFVSIPLLLFFFISHLSISYGAKYFIFRWLGETKKTPIFVTGLQGFLALFLNDYLFHHQIIGQDFHSLFGFLIVGHIFLGWFALQVLSLAFVKNEERSDLEYLLEIQETKEGFDNTPKGIKDTQLIFELGKLELNTIHRVSDFTEKYNQQTPISARQFIVNVHQNFLGIIEKLEKELEYVGKNDPELLKEKVRENRSRMALKYLELLKLFQKEDIRNHELLDINEAFISETLKIFHERESFVTEQTSVNLEVQKEDSITTQFIKFFKRSYLSTIRILIPNASLKRKIDLKNIFLYHFYERFTSFDKLFINKILHQNYKIMVKSHLFFQRMDEQFLSVLKFIDKYHKEEIFIEQIPHLSTQLREEPHQEFEVIENDFRAFQKENFSLLNRGIKNVLKYAFKDFVYAGTFQFKKSKRRPSKKYPKFEQLNDDLKHLRENWVKIYESKVNHITMELEITKLQNQIRKIVNQALESFTIQINKDVRDIIISTGGYRQVLLNRLNSRFNSGEIIDENLINDFRKKFLYQIKINTQSTIENTKFKRKLSNFISDLIGQIHQLVNDIPSIFSIGLIEKSEIADGVYPETIKLFDAPFREITRTFLEMEVTRSLSELSTQISVGIENLSQMFSVLADKFIIDIDQLFTDLNSSEEKSKEYLTQFTEIMNSYDKDFDEAIAYTDLITQSVNDTIVKEVVQKIRKIREIIINQTETNLHSSIEKFRASEKPITDIFIVRSSKYFRKQFFKYSEKYKTQIQILKKIFIKFRKKSDFLPLTVDSQIDRLSLQNITKKLPFVYQKLLSLEAVEIRDFLFGRDFELSEITNAYLKWRDGQKHSVAVYGDQGNGKTSIINHLVKYVFEKDAAYRIKIPAKRFSEKDLLRLMLKPFGVHENLESLDQLKEIIVHRDQKNIFFIEAVHRLLQYKIGGLSFIKRFLIFMEETKDRVFWVHSYNNQSWEYLCQVMDLSDFYQKTIEIKKFTDEEIYSILRQRNKMSGFQLSFPEISSSSKKIFGRDSSLDSENREKEFFLRLVQLSNGNIFSAIYYWLDSIREVKDNIAYLNPLRKLELHELKNFDDIKIFTLKHMIIQGFTTIKEHSSLFRISEENSRIILNQMSNKNIILEQNGNFSINKIAYSLIVEELKRRKLLYE